MIRRPPRSTLSSSSAASDVYKRQFRPFPQVFISRSPVLRLSFCPGELLRGLAPGDIALKKPSFQRESHVVRLIGPRCSWLKVHLAVSNFLEQCRKKMRPGSSVVMDLQAL